MHFLRQKIIFLRQSPGDNPAYKTVYPKFEYWFRLGIPWASKKIWVEFLNMYKYLCSHAPFGHTPFSKEIFNNIHFHTIIIIFFMILKYSTFNHNVLYKKNAKYFSLWPWEGHNRSFLEPSTQNLVKKWEIQYNSNF